AAARNVPLQWRCARAEPDRTMDSLTTCVCRNLSMPGRHSSKSNHRSPRIMNHRFTKRFAAVAALLLLSASGGAALAQRGAHGHHAGDASFGIAALKDQLNPNTSQQAMWDSAVAQTKEARDRAR